MPSGYSVLEYQGDGVTTVFAVNFTLGYLKKSDIYCRVGDEVDGSGNPAYRVLEDIPGDPGRMRVLGEVPTAAQKVLFRRITSKTTLQNDYADGEALDDDALDNSFKQQLMIAHELLDGYGLSTVYSDIDLTQHKIVNVVTDPNDPTSLCNVGYAGQAPLHSAAALAAQVASEAARDTSIAAKDQSVQAAADAEVSRAAAVVAEIAAEAAVSSSVQVGAFTAAWDMIVGSGPGAYIKKSLYEVAEAIRAQLVGVVSGYTRQQYAVPVAVSPVAGAVTLDAELHQEAEITSTQALTMNAPTQGVKGMRLFLRLYAASALAISWNAVFKANADVALPAAHVAGKGIYLDFRYDGASWVLMGKVVEA